MSGGNSLDGLRARRRVLGDWLAQCGREHLISLASATMHETILELIGTYARESCLDAGAGRPPYRRSMEEGGVRAVSIDREQRSSSLDLVGDV